jgi:hypothetical protein
MFPTTTNEFPIASETASVEKIPPPPSVEPHHSLSHLIRRSRYKAQTALPNAEKHDLTARIIGEHPDPKSNLKFFGLP